MGKSHRNKKTKSNLRKKEKGGMKQKNAQISSWQAVFRMINNPTARLTKIAFSSLKGFIFKLDVEQSEENSEFLALNADGSRFTEHVYSLIFKFAIIGEHEDDLELPNLIIPGDRNDNGELLPEGREKETEDLESFKKEAKVQQEIYAKTVSPAGKPICLAVVDFSTFNGQSSAALLTKLLTIAADDTAQRMLTYLMANVTPRRKLGLLTMELANPEFRELKSINTPETVAAYNSDCAYAMAQLFILFTQLGVVNYDCHDKNVLASRAPPVTGDGIRSILIDFGRTLDFLHPEHEDPFPLTGNDEYDRDDRESINSIYTEVSGGTELLHDYEEIKALVRNPADLYPSARRPAEQVIEIMNKIVKFMACIDYAMNKTYFIMKNDRAQMIALLKYLYGDSFSENWGVPPPPTFVINKQARARYTEIIPILVMLTQVNVERGSSALSYPAIKTAMHDGRLFSVKDGVNYDRSYAPTRRGAVSNELILEKWSQVGGTKKYKYKFKPFGKHLTKKRHFR